MSKNNTLVILSRIVEGADPYLHSSDESYRQILSILLINIWENPHFQGNVMIIFFSKGVTVTHLRKFTPACIADTWRSYRLGIPARIKGIHAFDLPAPVMWVEKILKAIVSEKLSKRIHINQTLENLYDNIPQDIMPKDLGGNEETIDVLNANWLKKLEKYRDRIMEHEKTLRDLDHCRPIEKDEEDMAGSFRQLTVD